MMRNYKTFTNGLASFKCSVEQCKLMRWSSTSGSLSPASLKRVTNSDNYRVAANCPVGAAAGFAADGGDPSGRQDAA